MIDYRILPDQKLTVVCVWKTTHLEDIMKLSRRLQKDPGFCQDFDTIVENTQIENPLTRDDIYTLSKARFDKGKPVGKVAVIAADDVVYGMSRMHEMMSEFEGKLKIHIFRDASSALEWLDREGLDIDTIFKEIRGE